MNTVELPTRTTNDPYFLFEQTSATAALEGFQYIDPEWDTIKDDVLVEEPDITKVSILNIAGMTLQHVQNLPVASSGRVNHIGSLRMIEASKHFKPYWQNGNRLWSVQDRWPRIAQNRKPDHSVSRYLSVTGSDASGRPRLEVQFFGPGFKSRSKEEFPPGSFAIVIGDAGFLG
jgi:hypothetical protein